MRKRIASHFFPSPLPSVGFFILLIVFFFSSSLLFAQTPPQTGPQARNDPHPWEVSAAFRTSILIGSADPIYTWSRLYHDGLGGGLALSRRAFRGVRLQGSIFYDHFEGKEVISSVGSGSLDSLSLLSFSLGFRLYPIVFFRSVSTRFRPYISVDLGGSYFSGIRFNGGSNRNYPDTIDFAYGVGGGIELLLWDRLIPFMEAKYQNAGRPNGVADSFENVPVVIGLRILL